MLPTKAKKTSNGSLAFRVRMGDREVEISGNRKEVLSMIKEMPSIMEDIYMAFEASKPKTKATLTVKASTAKPEIDTQKYPKIRSTESCGDAILDLLASDWGRWRPRTVGELSTSLKANRLDYSDRTIAGVLSRLVKKEKVKRWKTDAGFVYILAEKEILT